MFAHFTKKCFTSVCIKQVWKGILHYNGYTCFQNAFFLPWCLLWVQIYCFELALQDSYCCEANDTPDITQHAVRNYFFLHLFIYIKMFQINIADLDEIYILCHVPIFLYAKPFLREVLKMIWVSCKVGVVLEWYEPHPSHSSIILCTSCKKCIQIL